MAFRSRRKEKNRKILEDIERADERKRRKEKDR